MSPVDARPKPTRAAPLPPDERRAQLVDITRGLLAEYGGQFTTRQVAEAAGVAEGTIFRSFPTKAALLEATIEDVLDPTDTCATLRALPAADLDTTVVDIIVTLRTAITETSGIFAALHHKPDTDADTQPRRHRPPKDEPSRHQERAELLISAMVDVLAPYEHELSVTPREAGSFLRSVAMATTHPFLTDHVVDDPALIARLCLAGLATPHRAPEEHPC